jgi:hypothetical protein
MRTRLGLLALVVLAVIGKVPEIQVLFIHWI